MYNAQWGLTQETKKWLQGLKFQKEKRIGSSREIDQEVQGGNHQINCAFHPKIEI